MNIQEDIKEERIKEFNEYQCYLILKSTSEKGGMFTKDATDQKIEKVQNEFYRDPPILDYKYNGLGF